MVTDGAQVNKAGAAPTGARADGAAAAAPQAPAALQDPAAPHEPLYARLAGTMRDKIYTHEWGPRSKIPSEHELMAQYGVARGTVRRALKALVDEGLLVQERGRGTFVAEPGISHPAGERPISFARSLREQGKEFVTRVIDKSIQPASPAVAEQLGIEPGDDVVFLRRVRDVAGAPIMCQESWLTYRLCPGLFDRDYEVEPLFDAVEACSGRRIKYTDMRYTARVAGTEHARLLRCDELAAVLLLEQLVQLEDGTPVEWSLSWFPPGQAIVGRAVQAD